MAKNCPKCDTLADDTQNHLTECSVCKKWFHYKCIQMPIYFLTHLETTDNDYCCDSCVHEKNRATYPSRFDEISEIVGSFRINPATNIQVDNSNPSHDSSSTTSSPTSPSTPRSRTSINIDIKELITIDLEILVIILNHSHLTITCLFFAQARCTHGKYGYNHPKMCRQYLANNCNHDDCQFYHPSIYRNSRLNNFCDILHYRSYHFVGTYHPSSSSDYRYNNPHHNNNDYTNCQAQNRNMNYRPYVSNVN